MTRIEEEVDSIEIAIRINTRNWCNLETFPPEDANSSATFGKMAIGSETSVCDCMACHKWMNIEKFVCLKWPEPVLTQHNDVMTLS